MHKKIISGFLAVALALAVFPSNSLAFNKNKKSNQDI